MVFKVKVSPVLKHLEMSPIWSHTVPSSCDGRWQFRNWAPPFLLFFGPISYVGRWSRVHKIGEVHKNLAGPYMLFHHTILSWLSYPFNWIQWCWGISKFLKCPPWDHVGWFEIPIKYIESEIHGILKVHIMSKKIPNMTK